ncbi:MAG: peptide MFS transporter [Bacteroidota bacterium]
MANDPGNDLQSPGSGGATLASGEQWFGHPRGLSTLFFTEMWERFSYYGLRALLVLFMTAAMTAENAGFGFGEGQANAIAGLYLFFVYVLSLPGGWVADNVWGQKRAIFVGGIIIAAGHFTMAGPMVGLPEQPTFFLGLALVAIGTGFLKPNVSSVVGDLYPEGGARRDAGFSVFYMGINIGAMAGPFLCGLIGEGFSIGDFTYAGNWHLGFSLAGFGMVLGLVQYRLGAKYLDGVGDRPAGVPSDVLSKRERTFYLASAVAVLAVALLGFGMATGVIGLTLEALAGSLGVTVVLLVAAFFTYIVLFGGHSSTEKKRLGVIAWLFVLAALFWSGFEQASTSLNLFARDLTDRNIFGTVIPASTLQLINPLFIVIFAPIFGSLWVWLARRNANPSIPVKFALGLLGLSVGFFVLAWGSANATPEMPVSPAWLIVTYFFHTCGELCLSPVGLSSMTKLSPKSRVGQMMGVWFVAAALGNLIAGLVAGQLENLPASELFGTVAMIIGGGGVVALLFSPFVKRLTAGVD